MSEKGWKEVCTEKRRFWQVHIRAWERSGLSQNEYCQQNQLKSSQLCYWKKKLRNNNSSPVNFVPVPIQSNDIQLNPPGKDSGLTLYLRGDIRISLNNDFSPTTLSKVVAALGENHK